MKRESEQERLYLLERAERLNEIEKQIDDRFREADEIKAYNNEIDRYCIEYDCLTISMKNNAIGLKEVLEIIQCQREIIHKGI